MKDVTLESTAASKRKVSILREEAKLIVFLAIPITIAQLATISTGFVDTVMSGHASTVDLAGVAVGSSIWFPIMYALTGFLAAITTFVANSSGAKNYDTIKVYVQNGLWLALIVSLLIAFGIRSLNHYIVYLGLAENVSRVVVGYLDALSYGIPAFGLYLVYRGYTEGYDSTKPQMIISLLGLLVDTVTNYVLIFGKMGFPAFGGIGAGWATTVTFWFMLFSMMFYTYISGKYKAIRFYSKIVFLRLEVVKDLLKLGIPISVTFFIEASIFAVITLFIGTLGTDVVAGHQIALNFSSLLYAFPLGISIATTIRVGYSLGERQPKTAQLSSISGTVVALLFAMVASFLIILYAPTIAGFYTNDFNTLKIAIHLLFFAAIFQISDAVASPCAGALRGYQDANVTLIMSFISAWVIALPLGYILGLTSWLGPPLGVVGFWISLVAGTLISAIFLFIRFWKVSNKVNRGALLKVG